MTEFLHINRLGEMLSDENITSDDKLVIKWALETIMDQKSQINKLKKTIALSMLKKIIK